MRRAAACLLAVLWAAGLVTVWLFFTAEPADTAVALQEILPRLPEASRSQLMGAWLQARVGGEETLQSLWEAFFSGGLGAGRLEETARSLGLREALEERLAAGTDLLFLAKARTELLAKTLAALGFFAAALLVDALCVRRRSSMDFETALPGVSLAAASAAWTAAPASLLLLALPFAWAGTAAVAGLAVSAVCASVWVRRFHRFAG